MPNQIADQMRRRSFLSAAAAIAGAASLGSLSSTALAAPNTASSVPFRVYNGVVGSPDLATVGFAREAFAYENALITGGLPDEAKVRNVMNTFASRGVTRACLDIEAWNLNVPDADFYPAADKYNTVMDWAHDEQPNIDLGWYLMLPRRDYWSPYNGTTQGWYDDNVRRFYLASHLEIVYPSLYTFYEDQAGWVTYANANLDQGAIYGKPVYPTIWPEYHPSAPEAIRGTPIPAGYWRLQLETLFSHSQTAGSLTKGVVIWHYTWDSAAAWWAETQDFIADHGLV